MSTQEQKIDNPWRESIENILTGDNYFRAGEWRDLLADLDRLYAIEATVEQASRDAQRLIAGEIREPQNGAGWRIGWWNESMRLMLPEDVFIDTALHYKNGTIQLTIKRLNQPKKDSK